MVAVLVAGGEDSEWTNLGVCAVITTAGSFRSNVARCALGITNVGGGAGNAGSWINTYAFSSTSFWSGGLLWAATNSQTISGSTGVLWRARKAGGLPKLYLRANGAGLVMLEKVTDAGVVTALGAAFAITHSGVARTKIDIFCNYAVAGSFSLYVNRALVFSFTGDVTTNGDTLLAFAEFGSLWGSAVDVAWSELMVLDVDTRRLGLQTFAPVANGNTHNFDTGTPAAANVNEISYDDTTLDGSSAAGQIDQYTTPAVTSGIYGILAYGVSGNMAKGLTGPSKADLGLRISGTDYWSVDFTLLTSLQDYQNWWYTNPATTNPFAPTDIGTTAGFNIGVKSVT